METVKKLANAFYTDVDLSDRAPRIARFAANLYKEQYGGLWVGGEVILNRKGITFSPNALNQALHKNLRRIEIPASKIISVQRKFGWLTSIVEVEHDAGVFRFRCYGAKQLVEHFHGDRE